MIAVETARDRYEGNDVTTSFDFNFALKSEDDLLVGIIDTEDEDAEVELLTLNTDYSVSGADADGEFDDDGGSITYPISGDPLPDGYAIVLLRDMDILQELDLENQGDFSAADVEENFDKTVMILQQMQEQIDRCAKVPITSTLTGDEIYEDFNDNLTEIQEGCEAAQTAAELAETNAETAQGLAEDAQDAAEVAQTAAELAENNAETAEENAETAQAAAEVAQAAAEAAQVITIATAEDALTDIAAALESALEDIAEALATAVATIEESVGDSIDFTIDSTHTDLATELNALDDNDTVYLSENLSVTTEQVITKKLRWLRAPGAKIIGAAAMDSILNFSAEQDIQDLAVEAQADITSGIEFNANAWANKLDISVNSAGKTLTNTVLIKTGNKVNISGIVRETLGSITNESGTDEDGLNSARNFITL